MFTGTYTAFWAAKGGAGATVVSSAAAILAAQSGPTVVVDLDGDLACALGADDGESPGIAGWLAAGSDAPADALDRLLRPVGDGLHLLSRGRGSLDGDAELLGHLLAAMPRSVVVDAGTRPTGLAAELIRAADRSILVTRACYLGLRRARSFPVSPSGVVLVREPQRALTTSDVADAAGAPIAATIPFDPAVARAVDAGLLVRRLPRSLRRVDRCLR